MGSNRYQFQLNYNTLELLLAPGYMEKGLQLDNKNRLVIPAFFHPSEDEGRQSHVPKQEFQKPEQLHPLSPPVKSVSEIFFQTSTSDFRTSLETTSASTPAGMNTTITSTHFDHGDSLLHNTSSLNYNSTAELSSEEIGAVFIVCLMIPFIICSNLLVIFSVIRFRRLHTPTNYFITSLAAVDILVGLITPLVIAVQIFQNGGGQEMSDTVVCLLPNRILMMSCGVSLLNLATIAYDRYTALISPLEYVNIMTTRKVSVLMLTSWLYSGFVVWLPLVLGWYDSSLHSSLCSADLLHKKAHILFISAIFVPSCTVILICYSRIFLVARYHARSIAAVQFAVHRRLQVRFMIKDTKYAKTLALVIGGFLALWLPYLILNFVKTVSDISSNEWLETYLILLAVLNSGINPWIYAFKNNEFQAAFKRMAREHCRSLLCYRWQEKRGSLVSCVSTTPRLSRTDSRMASTTILDGQPDKTGHRNLDFLNSLDSDSSDYNPDSYQKSSQGVEKTFDNFNREISIVCELEYANENKVTGSSLSSPTKDQKFSSHTDTQTEEYRTVCLKDDVANPLKLSILTNCKFSKDNLAQFKKIKKKGAEIIRSTSALSAIRPHFLPVHRRPASSLPSSPVQSHNPFKPSLTPSPAAKTPETNGRLRKFNSFVPHSPTKLSPSSNLCSASMA